MLCHCISYLVSKHTCTKMVIAGAYYLVGKQIHIYWWELTLLLLNGLQMQVCKYYLQYLKHKMASVCKLVHREFWPTYVLNQCFGLNNTDLFWKVYSMSSDTWQWCQPCTGNGKAHHWAHTLSLYMYLERHLGSHTAESSSSVPLGPHGGAKSPCWCSSQQYCM